MDIIALSVANLLEMAMEVLKTSNKILTIWSGIAFVPTLSATAAQDIPAVMKSPEVALLSSCTALESLCSSSTVHLP